MVPNSALLTSDALGSVAYEQAMTIRNRIEELRNLRGWSQEVLARKIGVSKMAISRYENGETLTLDRMQQIAEAFECSVANVLNFAALANLKNEVEPAEMVGSVAAAMATKNLKVYKVNETSVDRAGVNAGDVITIDASEQAISDLRTGQLVLAEVELKGSAPTQIVRQYIDPGMLVTNRKGSNIVLSLEPDSSMKARILGVVIDG